MAVILCTTYYDNAQHQQDFRSDIVGILVRISI